MSNISRKIYLPVTSRIDEMLLNFQGSEKTLIIGIDGRCGCGKSTLSMFLAEKYNCSVIKTDDFFVPKELRTEERFQAPDANVHYERFNAEIIPKLSLGQDFEYDVFDCTEQRICGKRTVKGSRLIIIEGTYSLRREWRSLYDLKIFVTADPDIQLMRILKRSNHKVLSVFIDKWIPLEEIYFKQCSVKEIADIVLDTSNL